MNALPFRNSLRAFALATALVLAVAPHPADAQGASASTTQGYNYYQPGIQVFVEQFLSLDIDDDLEMDSYTEASMDLDEYGEFYDVDFILEVELDVYDNGSFIDGANGSGDGDGFEVTAECWDPTQSGHSYSAEGLSSIGYYDDSYVVEGIDANWVWMPVGDLYVSATPGNGPPNVDSINPTGGNVGDTGVQITLYGEYLSNSDGSMPTFWTYPSGLSLTAQSVSSDGSQLNATYTIPSGTQTAPDGIIDVITDMGTSNDSTFTVGYPPAAITGLSSYSWEAPSSPFQLQITGTGFGTEPTVSVYDPANSVTAGNAYNTSADGTTTYIDVTVGPNAPSEEATITLDPSYATTVGGSTYQEYQCGSGCGGSPTANGQASASAAVSPQIPTTFPIFQTQYSGPPTCTAGTGWQRNVIRQVYDQNDNPIAVSFQDMEETVTPVSGANGLNISISTSPALTDPTGQALDTFSFCSTACPASTATSTFTQVVTDTWNGTIYPVGS